MKRSRKPQLLRPLLRNRRPRDPPRLQAGWRDPFCRLLKLPSEVLLLLLRPPRSRPRQLRSPSLQRRRPHLLLLRPLHLRPRWPKPRLSLLRRLRPRLPPRPLPPLRKCRRLRPQLHRRPLRPVPCRLPPRPRLLRPAPLPAPRRDRRRLPRQRPARPPRRPVRPSLPRRAVRQRPPLHPQSRPHLVRRPAWCSAP